MFTRVKTRSMKISTPESRNTSSNIIGSYCLIFFPYFSLFLRTTINYLFSAWSSNFFTLYWRHCVFFFLSLEQNGCNKDTNCLSLATCQHWPHFMEPGMWHQFIAYSWLNDLRSCIQLTQITRFLFSLNWTETNCSNL